VPSERLPLELRAGLRAGSVFYFRSRELTSREPHFFVVVNRKPVRAEILLLTIVTSNIADVRTRNRARMETVVEITPSEYSEFTRLSAVDCNVVLEKPLAELAGMVRRNEVRYGPRSPAEYFRKDSCCRFCQPSCC